MSIKRYNQFINEEESYLKRVIISLAAMLSLGLTRSQVLDIKDDSTKLSVIDTLISYNKNPKGVDTLKYDLLPKVNDPDKFVQDYLKILPDKTIVVRPNFINGLELDVNPVVKSFHVTYTIKF
jgi:hypothetical protein